MKKILIVGAVAMSIASASTAMARPSLDELDKYATTNETETCVQFRSIRNTRVLDDRHILFFMNGGTTYLNTLPNTCSQLGFQRSFSYSPSGSQLCNVDLITVIEYDNAGVKCRLGKFQKLEKATDKEG